MPARPRSVPPTLSTSTRVTRSSRANLPLPSDGLIAVHRTSTIRHDAAAATITTTSNAASASSSASVAAGSRLVAQADALAKMTLEMNLRSVSKQANRLEQELRALVRSTAQDEAFRAQHESRLQDMWKEILAVKAHAAQADEDGRRDATRHLADEECRHETRRAMDEMRSEIAGVKELVGGLASTLAEMPSAEQMQAALSQSSEGDAARDRQESMLLAFNPIFGYLLSNVMNLIQIRTRSSSVVHLQTLRYRRASRTPSSPPGAGTATTRRPVSARPSFAPTTSGSSRSATSAWPCSCSGPSSGACRRGFPAARCGRTASRTFAKWCSGRTSSRWWRSCSCGTRRT